MSEAVYRIEARCWLCYADEDLRATEALLPMSGVQPRHLCSLAQQAAEWLQRAGPAAAQTARRDAPILIQSPSNGTPDHAGMLRQSHRQRLIHSAVEPAATEGENRPGPGGFSAIVETVRRRFTR